MEIKQSNQWIVKYDIGIAILFVLMWTFVSLADNPVTEKKRRVQINKLGNVSIIYEKERDSTRTGLTKYKYKWKRRFRYTYKYRTQEDKVYLTITVHATIDPNISHRIYLPYNNRGKSWYSRLLAHEYDHVCISLDERPRLLLHHLASHFKISNIQVNSKDETTKSFICSQVNTRLDEYENAIEEIVRKNYKLLDHIDVSNHGKKPIPNRKVFFQGLYTRENLAKHKFKYITEVATLLESKEYKNAKIYYTFNTKKRRLKGLFLNY